MNRQALAKVIHSTAIYYGRDILPEVLTMMCDDLADLDPQSCIEAYQKYRRNPANRTFPLPAQIREIVNPQEFITAKIKARETAARIVGAATTFGWNNAKEAEVYIGPNGWNAVNRLGGWSHICQNLGVSINPGTFQAQLRDMLESSYEHGVETIEQAIGALPPRRADGELTKIGNILKI